LSLPIGLLEQPIAISWSVSHVFFLSLDARSILYLSRWLSVRKRTVTLPFLDAQSTKRQIHSSSVHQRAAIFITSAPQSLSPARRNLYRQRAAILFMEHREADSW